MSIIPSQAKVVASFRLPPKLDAYKLNKQWEELTQNYQQNSVTINYKSLVLCKGFGTKKPKNKTILIQVQSLGFNPYQGILPASLPIGEMIEKEFGQSPQILSFGSSQDNAHGSNESISLEALINLSKVITKLVSKT